MTSLSAPPRRVGWDEIPAQVRDAVADLLGSPVVAARSQSGGFSPGSADRVLCADGRRAFVKTATADRNPQVVGIHRREAAVAAVLPGGVPAPRLIGTAGGDDWIALAFEEIDGASPRLPWQPDALEATLDAFARVAAAPLDAAARRVLRPIDGHVAELAGGWARLLADPPTDDHTHAPSGEPGHPLTAALTDPDVAWAWERAPRWAAAAPDVVAQCRGESLVHYDARSDNILLDAAGTAVLVDWPWAARGAPWFDAVLLLVDVRMHDADADIARLRATHPVFAAADDAAVAGVLAAFAGFMLDAGRRPAPPGLPTLSEFQLTQGAVACCLLREQLGA
ncbi:phosphotransferase [Microbacterium sp. Sa4CUA7]|uniref:Phosphotransferase n=1 Tax=Microbacterium pullorum TaxID=2762236 RepID=A0ABR8RXT5_9MICO|nr:phosphotransferase [Microbacterium pullorum]MBD7956049.1 phosphotransferase [Microbacterium pullorum]